MNATKILRASTGRTPLIQFIGKRTVPETIDHSPRPHPAASTKALPNSFAEYRKKAQQYGPLGGYNSKSSSVKSAVSPAEGQAFDRNELPARFWRLTLSREEMEIVESGGAAMA